MPISINEASRNSNLVKPWAQDLLSRIRVQPGDPRAGISHPTDIEADSVAQSISNVEVVEPSTLFVWGAEDDRRRAEAAAQTARRVFAVIPVLPQFVGFAESINALADTSDSAAEWANQRRIRVQLADAANLTLEDLKQGTPWIVIAVAAAAALFLLRG
jgi:hypothetical protein